MLQPATSAQLFDFIHKQIAAHFFLLEKFLPASKLVSGNLRLTSTFPVSVSLAMVAPTTAINLFKLKSKK